MFTTLAHAASYGPGPFWFFPIFWFLVIGLLIFTFKRSRWQRQGQASAEGVLRERFARGEIDDTEYRQRLEVLRTKK